MGKVALPFVVILLFVSFPLVAQTHQDESLGDVARQLRVQRDKDAKKAAKVFTNDNLPAPVPGEAISVSSLPPENPSTPPQTTSKPDTPPASTETSSKPTETPEGKERTRDYWQTKFKAARQDVAKVKELEQLSEDELNLLQLQQAREMDPNTKAELTAKVQAKQSEVDVLKATMNAAQKALEELEKEFKDSGAPQEWSNTEQTQAQAGS